jgi:hypothetical protein
MACAPTPTPAVDTASAPTPGPGGAEPVAPPATPQVDPANPPEDACHASQYAALIGKPVASDGVPKESADVRYIRPNTQVTMDFRADRLNIDIDAADVITGFRCT